MLDRLKESLKDRAKDVRTTSRLVDSPACLVVEEGDISGHLARMLKQSGQAAPKSQPILEVNADHALVKRLDGSAHFDDLAHILFDQALWPKAANWRTRRPTCGGSTHCSSADRHAPPSAGSAIASICSRRRIVCCAQ